jgi:hypothetical protein
LSTSQTAVAFGMRSVLAIEQILLIARVPVRGRWSMPPILGNRGLYIAKSGGLQRRPEAPGRPKKKPAPGRADTGHGYSMV